MSTIIMSRCWPLQMPPSPKAVLISLADNANDHGYCWPSITTICERTCLGKTAVIEAIKWLEQAGYLIAEKGAGRNNRYTITVDNADLFHRRPPVRQTNQSGCRTSPADEPAPVREPDQSGIRSSPAGGPNPSASRTGPVRQADPNRKEPSRTVTNDSTADASAADPPPRGRRGTRLPDGWQPSEAVREWAAAEFPAVSIEAELATFTDYWRAVPGQRGVKLDWDATFRNRVREIAARRRPGESHVPHRESAAGRAARLCREGDERERRAAAGLA